MVFPMEASACEGPDDGDGAHMEKSAIMHPSGLEITCDFTCGQ